PGQELDVYSNNNQDRKFRARVQFINHSLNADRAAVVIAKLDRYDTVFIPGLFVNADVRVTNKKSLSVPEDAVTQWQGKSYVFIQKSAGSYEMIPVTVGIAQDGELQVSSEKLSANTKVVIKNAYSLLMKARNSMEED